ncbi:hypothetical protein RRG08_036641 [Elysia crispata]|uniref:Uncharacterized protein n=1 Tax=Elysia crispata TaxID=231223 RepID=A0AAE0YRC8_9GAST|nr:hypothetical protein RRG08_036641 [Elysia crispata]
MRLFKPQDNLGIKYGAIQSGSRVPQPHKMKSRPGKCQSGTEPCAVCCTSLPCDYSLRRMLPGASRQSRFSCRPLERVKISAPYKRCISSCKRTQWKFQRSSCG